MMNMSQDEKLNEMQSLDDFIEDSVDSKLGLENDYNSDYGKNLPNNQSDNYKNDRKPYAYKPQSHDDYHGALKMLRKIYNQLLDKMEQDLLKFKEPYKNGLDKNFESKVYSGNSDFEKLARAYLSGEGKELSNYLKSKGRDLYNISGIGTTSLDNVVAGLGIYGSDAKLIGSHDFDKKISNFASKYGVSNDRAVQYVLAHELVHASQKNKYFANTIEKELDVEHTLMNYFSSRGQNDLAYIASERARNVFSNYGSSGSMPSNYSGNIAAPPSLNSGSAHNNSLSSSGSVVSPSAPSYSTAA